MSGDDKNEQSVMLSLDEILNQDPTLSGFNSTTQESTSTPKDVDLDELSRIGLTQDHIRAAPMTGAHLAQPLVLKEKQMHPVLKALGLSIVILGLLAGGIFLGIQFNQTQGNISNTNLSKQPVATRSTPVPKKTPVVQKTSVVPPLTPKEKKDDSSLASSTQLASASSTSPTTKKTNKPKKVKSKYRKKARKTSQVKKAEPKVEPKPEPKPKPKPKKASAADNLLKSLNTKKSTSSKTILDQAALPTKLTRSQILKVTRKNQRSINRCRAHTNEQIQAVVKVVVNGAGNVSKAQLVRPKNKIGSPLDQCLVSRIKAFKFPKFSGPPMRFNLPFFL